MKLRTDAIYFLSGEKSYLVELSALAEHSNAKPEGSVVLKNFAGYKSIQKFFFSLAG